MSQDNSSTDKKSGSSDRSIPVALISTGGVIVAALIGAGALFLARGGSSGASVPPSQTTNAVVSASPSGTITYPPNGASNVAAKKNLQLSGTAQDIPSGYRLTLSLEFLNVKNYYIDDPNTTITLHNGHWTAAIYIGDPGYIVIRLLMLSPSQIAYVNSEPTYQNNGFPALPGAVLAAASYRAP